MMGIMELYLPGIDLHEWPFKSLISFLQQIANLAYRNIELVGDQRTKFKLNGFGEILSDVHPFIDRHFNAPLSSLYIASSGIPSCLIIFAEEQCC